MTLAIATALEVQIHFKLHSYRKDQFFAIYIPVAQYLFQNSLKTMQTLTFLHDTLTKHCLMNFNLFLVY